MLNPLQASTMLALQAQMNAKINPAWVQAAYPYLRAVVVEGAEAMEHHGWKWWKKQHCDMEQLRMELVDIWHFTLSHILLEHQGDEAASLETLLRSEPSDNVDFDGKCYRISEMDFMAKLQLNIGLAAAQRISLPLFEALLTDCDMDWQALFCQYVGKNVLNFFRQDHGYKEGTYRKLWQGREDNEHLVEVMATLDPGLDDYQHQLYMLLKQRYAVI